jgi:hypothetical protein
VRCGPGGAGRLDDGRFPRLKSIYADEKYKDKALDDRLAARGDSSVCRW